MAVVIMSVGLTFIVRSMAGSLRAIVFSSDYLVASILLENHLASLSWEGTSEPVEIYGKSFSVEEKSISVLSVDDKEGVSGEAKQIEVEVHWGENSRRARTVASDTYVFVEEPKVQSEDDDDF